MRWKGVVTSIGVLLAIVIGGGALAVTVWSRCSNVRDCYALWRLVTKGSDPKEREREGFISQFAASPDLLVFPTPLEDNSVALIAFDRANKKPRLLVEPEATLHAPFLSRDKKRLLFSRHRNGALDRDIIVCDVDTWDCKIIVNVEGTVFSPAELTEDDIVYVSSPKVVGHDGQIRYNKNDVFLARNGKSTRISDLGFYEMSSLSVTSDYLYTSGIQRKADEISRFERNGVSETNKLEPIQFISAPDLSVSTVVTEPLNAVSASYDGQLIAFRQAENAKDGYRYNLKVMNLDKKLVGLARVTGISGRAMSGGQFIGRSIYFNELFADRYIAKSWDIANDGFETIAEVGYADIQSYERIVWTIKSKRVAD